MTTATKYKTYSKYKPSGADWLGDIPDNWVAKRLRFLVSLQKGRKPDENTESIDGLPYLTMDYLRGQEEPTKYAPVTESVVIEKGDILLLWDGANAGEFVNGIEGILSSTMTKVSFDKHKVNSRFYRYFLISFEKKLREMTIGMGIPHVSGDIVKDCIAPIPSDTEQKSIADFLDQETSKINEMVAKKQKMMALLKEKRQALITHAVTKGLDPKAKMKPSGIDWLGDIPEEWNIKKLKYIVKAKRGAIKTGPFGSDLTRDDYVFDKESSFAKIYTQQNIIENDLSLGDDYITEEKYLELIACTLEKDDVVLTTRGTLGRSMIFTSEAPMGIMHPCLLRVQLDERRCLKEFFQLLIQESHYFLEQLGYISNVTTIEVLYGDTLKPMQIALPNILDQKKILEYIAQKSKWIDEMMQKVEMQIEKLQEYRQALITSAVTGKIKV